MEKVILLQCPSKYAPLLEMFTTAANRLGFFDKYLIVTDSDNVGNLPDNAKVFKIEKDLQFSSNLLYLIAKEECPDIFFFFCEDQVIMCENEKIDNMRARLNDAWSFVLNDPTVGHMKVIRKSNADFLPSDCKVFCELNPHNKFYVDYQPAIWRKEFMLSHLRPGEDAWVSEKEASARVREFMKSSPIRSYSCRDHVITYMNCMRSGSYYRDHFVDYAEKHNLPLSKKFDVYVYVPNLTLEQREKLGISPKFLRSGKNRTPCKLKDYIKYVLKDRE